MPKEPRNHFLPPHHWDEFAVLLGPPERLLMWAVLQRALMDSLSPHRVGPEAARTAAIFFEDREADRHWIFSFDSIASHLAPNGDCHAFKSAVRRVLASGKMPFKNVKPQ